RRQRWHVVIFLPSRRDMSGGEEVLKKVISECIDKQRREQIVFPRRKVDRRPVPPCKILHGTVLEVIFIRMGRGPLCRYAAEASDRFLVKVSATPWPGTEVFPKFQFAQRARSHVCSNDKGSICRLVGTMTESVDDGLGFNAALRVVSLLVVMAS